MSKHVRTFFSIVVSLLMLLSTQIMAASCDSPTALADRIKEFNLQYDAKYKGMSVKNERRLEKQQDGSYLLSGKMSWLFLGIKEFSKFELSTAPTIRPLEYRYDRKGMGDSKDFHIEFDWKKMRAVSLDKRQPWNIAFKEHSQDLLSHQMQLRLDLLCEREEKVSYSYPLVKKKRIRTYTYHRIGEEIIDTALGKLRVVKLEKREENSKRKVEIWLAKDWDYVIAKLTFTDKDESSYGITLKDGTLGDRDIRGLN